MPTLDVDGTNTPCTRLVCRMYTAMQGALYVGRRSSNRAGKMRGFNGSDLAEAPSNCNRQNSTRSNLVILLLPCRIRYLGIRWKGRESICRLVGVLASMGAQSSVEVVVQTVSMSHTP